MQHFIVEFLRTSDGPIVHSEEGSAPDLATAHAFAEIGLRNVNAYKLALAYVIRDAATGAELGRSPNAESG